MKLNYLTIPLAVALTAVAGSRITSANMSWYDTLKLPAIAPAGSLIGLVWTVIFALTALSILLFWQREKNRDFKKVVAWLFILNGVLNVLWSQVFFGWHLLGWALVEMVALNLVNLWLIILLWPRHKWSSLLLWPYFVWVCFATYLTAMIWLLN